MVILRALPALLLVACTSTLALADDPVTGAEPAETVSANGTLPPLATDDPAVVVDTGAIDEGQAGDDGASTDDGAVDDGSDGTDDGAVDDGNVDDGTADDGSVDDGSTDDGAVDDGGTGDDGSVDDDDYADDGATDDGNIDDTGSGDEETDEQYANGGSGGAVIRINDGEPVFGGVIKLEDGTVVLRDVTAGGIYTVNTMGSLPGDALPPVMSPMNGGAESPTVAPTVQLALPDATGATLYQPIESDAVLGANEPIVAIGASADATGVSPSANATEPAQVRIRAGHLVATPN